MKKRLTLIAIVISFSYRYLPVAAKIVESFVLIGGLPFLQVHHGTIFHTLGEVLGAVNSRGLPIMTPVLDLILQIFPAAELPVLKGVFGLLLQRLMDEKESDDALIHIACVFARLAVKNAAFLVQMAGEAGGDAVFARLLDVWINKSYVITISLSFSYDRIPRKAKY